MDNRFNTRNINLDAIKGIACIMVILMHRRFPGEFGEIFVSLTRMSVAIFFVVSGYFTYSINHDKSINIIKRRIKHTFHLLCVSLIFYFGWESFLRLYGSGLSALQSWILNDVLNLKVWLNALIWDRDPFAGHLWFIFSLLKVYLLALLLIRIKNEWILNIIPGLCLGTLLLLEFVGISLLYYRNGWLYGMGFFCIGYCFSLHANYIEKFLSIRLLLGVFVLGIIINLIEFGCFGIWQIYFGTILTTCSVFLIAVNSKTIQKKSWYLLSSLGLKYSTVIYIIHWAINEVFIKIGKMISISDIVYQWIAPFLVVIISILASILIVTGYNKFFKYQL